MIPKKLRPLFLGLSAAFGTYEYYSDNYKKTAIFLLIMTVSLGIIYALEPDKK